MKRKAKLYLNKAISSLILSVDHFNNSSDTGRVDAFLILIHHSFEMLLKASLLERGARIQDSSGEHTYGYDKCLRKALTDGEVKFLTEEQSLTLQMIYGQRNVAQHSLIAISEQQLYLHAQSGLTVFRDILKKVFKTELSHKLPARVFPISTLPPLHIEILFRDEVAAINSLLEPGKRRRAEAFARLRPLAIMEATLQGDNQIPSDKELGRLANAIQVGMDWDTLFPNVSSIQISTDGSGPSLKLYFTKREGIPVHPVSEGTPGASAVGIRRVNELGYYTLGLKALSPKVELTMPKCLAVIRYLDLQSSDEYYKEIIIGKSRYKRYSPKAITRIREALPTLDIGMVWAKHGAKRSKSKP